MNVEKRKSEVDNQRSVVTHSDLLIAPVFDLYLCSLFSDNVLIQLPIHVGFCLGLHLIPFWCLVGGTNLGFKNTMANTSSFRHGTHGYIKYTPTRPARN